jgi:Putative zinc-finger/Gram-negative bacterial TonB protein C-terminal
MTCTRVRGRLSEWLDGELEPGTARAVSSHLQRCAECARRADELRAVSSLLAGLPRLEARESVAAQVLDRLEMETEARTPALAVLFRGFAAARPLMLPSLVPAGLIVVSVLAGVLALDPGPLPEVHLAPGAWGVVPASGTEGNPLFPSADVSLPRETAALDLSPEMLAGRGDGSLFVETVVARDGTVAGVTVLEGSAEGEEALVKALRQQRYEPVRYRGRPVAVSVYRLISRVNVEGAGPVITGSPSS